MTIYINRATLHLLILLTNDTTVPLQYSGRKKWYNHNLKYFHYCLNCLLSGWLWVLNETESKLIEHTVKCGFNIKCHCVLHTLDGALLQVSVLHVSKLQDWVYNKAAMYARTKKAPVNKSQPKTFLVVYCISLCKFFLVRFTYMLTPSRTYHHVLHKFHHFSCSDTLQLYMWKLNGCRKIIQEQGGNKITGLKSIIIFNILA